MLSVDGDLERLRHVHPKQIWTCRLQLTIIKPESLFLSDQSRTSKGCSDAIEVCKCHYELLTTLSYLSKRPFYPVGMNRGVQFKGLTRRSSVNGPSGQSIYWIAH